MDVGLAGRLHDLLHARLPTVIPVLDVVRNAPVKQDRLLRHNPNLGAHVGHVDALDALALHLQRPAVEVVEALNQLDDCRLAAARLADQGDALACLDVQGHAVEHSDIGPRRVVELAVGQLDVALHRVVGGTGQTETQAGTLAGVYQRLPVEQVEDPSGSHRRLVKVRRKGKGIAHHAGSANDRIGHLEHILKGDLVPVDQHAAVERGNAPAKELHGLGKSENKSTHMGPVHGHGVGRLEQVHVHIVVGALALEAGHSADVGDGLDGQLGGPLEGLDLQGLHPDDDLHLGEEGEDEGREEDSAHQT